jgi:hypothetical protein
MVIEQKLFKDIDISDVFFDSFKFEYPEFENRFIKNHNEIAYVTSVGDKIGAFISLKIEGPDEDYNDIYPVLPPDKRLKIRSFKIDKPYRYLKDEIISEIVNTAFDNNIDTIYFTIFDRQPEHKKTIAFFEKIGFVYYGIKNRPVSCDFERMYIHPFGRREFKSCE